MSSSDEPESSSTGSEAAAEPTSDQVGAASAAGAEAAPVTEAASSEVSESKGSRAKGGGISRWWWILLAIFVVEMWIYGSRGQVEVCVGKEGVHDFALVGSERTDENRWSFPRCEERLNLGLRSHFDEQVDQAVLKACRGATMFRHRGEGPACVERSDGWTQRVQTRYIWPWDARFYEHLFWFLS